MRHIALLRGINVGRNRKVSMAALRDVLDRAGYTDVRTHLQSGNVLLTSGRSPEALQRDLERRIESGFGIDVQVLVRTRDELADVVDRNPLAGIADNPSRYLVSFLSSEPGPELVGELTSADVAPDQFAISGREIYAWHPNGVQDSLLAKVLAKRRPGLVVTARNWNTVTKLLQLADA